MPAIDVSIVIDQLINKIVTATNHNIYEQKRYSNDPKFEMIPHVIYYYHIDFTPAHEPRITRYVHDNGTRPIPYDQVEKYITDLAHNHRGGGTVLQSDGQGLSGRPWQRKSYIVLLMDSQAWRFVPCGPTNNNAAVVCVPGGIYSENQTFFDGGDATIDMTGAGKEFCTAVYFVNHMKKNEQGDDIEYEPDGLTPQRQNFKFTFWYYVRDATGAYDLHSYDPTGTNLGPPAAPPP